jgi:hypothetical protein
MNDAAVTLRIPRAVLVIATVILVGGALATVGFLLGRDSARANGSGASSQTVAEAVARGRKAGYAKGFAAGKKAATPKRTFSDGVDVGRRRGYGDGAAEALGGTRFQLRAGAYYIVKFAEGSHSARLQLDSAADLVPGHSYEICNTYDLCYR